MTRQFQKRISLFNKHIIIILLKLNKNNLNMIFFYSNKSFNIYRKQNLSNKAITNRSIIKLLIITKKLLLIVKINKINRLKHVGLIKINTQNRKCITSVA